MKQKLLSALLATALLVSLAAPSLRLSYGLRVFPTLMV